MKVQEEIDEEETAVFTWPMLSCPDGFHHYMFYYLASNNQTSLLALRALFSWINTFLRMEMF